jgi:16S rRNA C967 or C1407 C5-methylase (RsmB/RsmF family)
MRPVGDGRRRARWAVSARPAGQARSCAARSKGVPEQPARDAFPAWLADAVERDWPSQARAIFAASLQPAPLWLRASRAGA